MIAYFLVILLVERKLDIVLLGDEDFLFGLFASAERPSSLSSCTVNSACFVNGFAGSPVWQVLYASLRLAASSRLLGGVGLERLYGSNRL